MASAIWAGSKSPYKETEFGVQDDSSESDGEPDPAKPFHRKISTNKEIKMTACVKEGYMMKQTSSFQRWRKRYFKLKGRRLYYAKDTKSVIFDEIDLTDLSVAECSTKNINHSFQVITPFRNLVLCADKRKEMEEWITALKSVGNREYYEANANFEQRAMMSGQHNWYACSHARPTYCNVCRDTLSGVTSHGLSCEVCKFKAHKRCAVRATNNCKWATLAAIGRDIIEEEDGTISMPHQWLEGNLPVSAKCVVCDKTCGSVLRLQDWRCLWCKAMVHNSCRQSFPKKCPMGQSRVSILPPTAVNNIDSDGYWEASRPLGTSPLLVFVNSKSGDNQGVKFLRRFKQLLNPAQVFDLMNGGPYMGLRLFQSFDPFRILVCGGDGSIGWVLWEIDKLRLHKQCQVGVLPLGTGNDLARVLGWGAAFDDDTQLPAVLEKLEHSQIKMLDRWSIMTYEGSMPAPRCLTQQFDPISVYEDSVAAHLSKILHSDDHSIVISSAKVLCETVKDFVAKVGASYEADGDVDPDSISKKCTVLNEKLTSLLDTLNEEAEATQMAPLSKSGETGEEIFETDILPQNLSTPKNTKAVIFKARDALMSRANSLKKAVRQIIEHTERAVDEQNELAEKYSSEILNLSTMPALSRSSDNILDSNRVSVSPKSEPLKKATSLLTVQSGSSVAPPVGFLTPELGRKSKKKEKKSPTRRISSMSTYKAGYQQQELSREPSPLLNTGAPSFPMLPSATNVAGKLAGGSFISKVLLANADALCAAVSPLVEEEISIDEYSEKCVMNNYFGIGLDAKIMLDFHIKREEHPEKLRSRTKNMMWFGVLGTKEIVQKTFKNLDERVQLECDGQRIPLPNLQGIVILNIPSYMGGTNFWGGTKEDDNFAAPSFDDKILEVVAVFGSMQMAMSRVINLQHHRIAQCRSVKITIMGDEGVPVQVDGEAWLQPPGYIRLQHKNRAQMLTRDRNFEYTLKSWSEKQKTEHMPAAGLPLHISHDETTTLQSFVDVTASLIKCIKIASNSHSAVEQDLFHLATQASGFIERLYPAGKLAEPTIRSQVSDLVSSVKVLCQETNTFLSEKAPNVRLRVDLEENLSGCLADIEVDMKKMLEMSGLVEHEDETETKKSKGKFKLFKKGGKKEKPDKIHAPTEANIYEWGTEEVAQWLSSLGLSEYRDSFVRNDVRGRELLHLERRDLKDLGVGKVGHLKRIQQGIKDITNKMSGIEK